ncbi:MAG TPA: cellulase family glycosylhydrolase [Gaiellaceae bacterium]
MKRLAFIGLFAVLLAAAAGATTASAAPRPVLVGFEDEPSFLWAPTLVDNIAGAGEANANVLRLLVNWSTVASRKPSRATNPNDPAYKFDGLDDAVFLAQQRGERLLLTVWGTPKWASKTHKPNAAPAPATLGSFCSALASRYSGRSGHPPVTLFSVWNEPNLNQFLAPQYDKKGRDVAPRLYAGMFRACSAAIKRVNKSALVAAGETSPRGVDHPRKNSRIQPSHTPGRFAQLVAAVKPRIHFDAWAHHPYGVGFTGRATVPFRWPNVGVADLPRLELNLKRWFKRPSVPLWVTELAYQTRPERKGALTYAQQAAYLKAAFLKAVAVPQVQMFIWFVYRDTPGERWQSGLVRSNGLDKPAMAVWKQVTAPYSVDNPTLALKRGTAPNVALPLVVLQSHFLPGDPPLGVDYKVYTAAGALVVGAQTTTVPNVTGTGTFSLAAFKPATAGVYKAQLAINDIHGNVVYRTITFIVR